jgi:hypothetical protein
MFKMSVKKNILACLICSCVPMSLSAVDLSQQNTDWPCDQILVSEIQAAVVWAGPSITGMDQLWSKDREVEKLVRRFISPDYDIEGADKEIAEFAAKQIPEQKDQKLTLLFAGVIESLNEVRQKELHGILRYAQGQAVRANRLSEELDEMIHLQEDSSPAAQERFNLMQREMEIKQRMFDEREAFIQHLCTRPRVIEEKIGSLARTIAYYLE